MPIADLQRSLAEVGRIRLGEKVTNSEGKVRPSRLDCFRFTSPAEYLIEAVAGLYGGKVEPWDGGQGKQFQVVTDANLIPVYIPPQRIDPNYEQWGNAVCTRRCDGYRDVIHDQPCDCNPNDRKCKPTTRVNLMLTDVKGLGVWRLETHGIYAASELSQLAELIAGVRVPLPGRLLLQARMRKHWDREKGKVVTKDYRVPVIMLDELTMRQVGVGGDALTQALQGAQKAPAIGGSQDRHTVIAEAIAQAVTPDQLKALHNEADALDAEDLKVAIRERWLFLASQQRKEQLAGAPEKTDTPKDDTPDAPEGAVVEDRAPQGEVAEEGAPKVAEAPQGDGPDERRAAWSALLTVANANSLKVSDLDKMLMDRFQVKRTQATVGQMTELARGMNR